MTMRKDRLHFGRVLIYSIPLFILSLALLAATALGAETQDKPLRAWDLRQFGYLSEARDYSTACFLSEDLLLVAINQAPIINPYRLFEETPDAILVLLDIRNEKALRTTHMPVFKSDDSVSPAPEGQFLVLTLSEVKLCSADFHCDRAFPTKGPLRLSSDHTKVVVGGNLMTPRVVLDSRTLAPLAGEDSGGISAEWQRHFRPDDSFCGHHLQRRRRKGDACGNETNTLE